MSNYFGDLFGSYTPLNYNFNSGIDELTQQILDEQKKREEEQKKQELEKQAKLDKKAARKKNLIQALPFIIGALTAKDSGQSASFLSQYADLMATQSERAKQRKHELEKQKLAEEARMKEIKSAQDYQTKERLGTQIYNTSERQAAQAFSMNKADIEFARKLNTMGYNTELTKEVEGLQHQYRLSEQQQGFIHDSEMQSRSIANGLAQDMSKYIRSDTAFSLANKVASGAQPNDVERATLDYYGKIKAAENDQEKKTALVDYIYRVNHIQVPLEGVDPKQAALLGHIPTRPLNFDEIAPFVFEDPNKALQQLASPTNLDQIKTSTGDTVKQQQDRSQYNLGVQQLRDNNSISQAIRQEAGRINDQGRAVSFAKAIYDTYGYQQSKGMIDSLQIDPTIKQYMINTILEAEKMKEQLNKQLLMGPSHYGH